MACELVADHRHRSAQTVRRADMRLRIAGAARRQARVQSEARGEAARLGEGSEIEADRRVRARPRRFDADASPRARLASAEAGWRRRRDRRAARRTSARLGAARQRAMRPASWGGAGEGAEQRRAHMPPGAFAAVVRGSRGSGCGRETGRIPVNAADGPRLIGRQLSRKLLSLRERLGCLSYAQRLGLDLADALARHRELLAHFLKCVGRCSLRCRSACAALAPRAP